MKFLRISYKKGKNGGLSLFVVLFLLILYVAGVVEIGSFHAAIHASPREAELHSAVNESSACHQSVYHNISAESCEHKSHIVALKKCPLCHLTLQSFHLYDLKSDNIHIISPRSIKGETQTSIIGEILTLIPSRGPPAA